MQLLKSQLNKFYDALNLFDLSPGDFNVVSAAIGGKFQIFGSCILYNKEEYYFKCGEQDGVFFMVYSPSQNVMVEDVYVSYWNKVEEHFYQWAHSLKNELSEVDKWESLKNSINTANIKVIDSKEKFTYQEVLEV